MNSWWMVGLGGAIGSLIRFAVSKHLFTTQPGQFPWATFTVNLAGCFLIGWLYAWLNKYEQQQWAPLLLSGVLGGFTTFSAFGLEGLQLWKSQEFMLLFLYTGGSVCLGILLAAAGNFMGS